MKHIFVDRPDKALVQPTLENWVVWANNVEEKLQQLKHKKCDTLAEAVFKTALIDEIFGEKAT